MYKYAYHLRLNFHKIKQLNFTASDKSPLVAHIILRARESVDINVPLYSVTSLLNLGANIKYEEIAAFGISTQRGTFLNFDK